MPLNIKNQDVDRLIEEVVRITGESKTEAVRKALEERRQRLVISSFTGHDDDSLLNFLRDEVWPNIPPEVRGKPITKQEEEKILGYGDAGV